MSSPRPRRPASSRGATPRPRKIAGQSMTTRSDAPEELHEEPLGEIDREPWPEDDAPGMLASPKATRVLITVLAALALVLAAQGVWWVVADEPERTVARDDAAVVVPSGRPVVADELAVLEGVEAAAKAAKEIVAVDHRKYDDEVEAAAELMTADFEKQYRATAGDIEKQFVAQQTRVQVNVVGQGVVRANRTELEALIFLNQVVERVRDKKPETVVTPFKVLVKMVHTDQGWLVDGLETDERKTPPTTDR
jgi:Mce-associated membrane protein